MRTDLTPSEAAILNQSIPERGTGYPIINLVLDDLRDYPDTLKTSFIKRAAKGEMHYGYPLQANNGRDALVDAFQEMIDGALYLKQYMEEVGTKEDMGYLDAEFMYHVLLQHSDVLHDMILERGEEK